MHFWSNLIEDYRSAVRRGATLLIFHTNVSKFSREFARDSVLQTKVCYWKNNCGFPSKVFAQK